MKKLLTFSPVSVALCAQEKLVLAVIQRIKTEAFQNSKVMDQLFWIADVYGPRLTGSPGFTAAANWPELLPRKELPPPVKLKTDSSWISSASDW